MATDLTPDDIALELGLHRESVYRLLRAGVIPGYKAGLRHWRTTRAELDAFKADGGAKRVGRPRKKRENRYG